MIKFLSILFGLSKTASAMFIIFVSSLLLMPNSIVRANWPGFRGPTGLGYTMEENLPIVWDGPAKENVLWTSQLVGQGHASPIVWDDAVIVCTARWRADVDDRKTAIPEQHVLCYRVTDGKSLWDMLVSPGPWLRTDFRGGPGGGYAAATPVTDGKLIYCAFASSVLAAIDFQGKIAWQKPIVPYSFDVTVGSSPILYGDTVILFCAMAKKEDSRVVAFDKANGDVRWEKKFPQMDFGHSTPAIIQVNNKPQMLLVASGMKESGDALYSLDPADGRILWWCRGAGDASSPAYGKGLVYFDSGRGSTGVAVDPTGSGDVSNTHIRWTITQRGEGLSSPIVGGEYLYRLSTPGILQCWEMATGKSVYSERLSDISTAWASPIADPKGHLFLANAGKSYVVQAGPECRILAINDLGDGNHPSPAVSKGRMFLVGMKNLYCIGTKSDIAPEPLQAAAYVVDTAASGAADTNPGTEYKPFKTIQHAADSAKPGDTIFVMEGKYDEHVRVRSGGIVNKPVAFVAMPRRSAIVGGFDLEASYIRVEGFEITADKPATAVQLSAGHCEILDNYIHDMMTAVSGTVGKPSTDGNTRDYSAVAHNRIAYNKVYHCEYGCILGGEDWLVESNEVNRLFMYASGNSFDDCDYSRFFGKGCIQRYNYYHGSVREEIKTAHVDCLQTFTNNGEIATDLLFEYNTCFDFHQMCMVESAPHIGSVRGWTFRYNIISPNSPTMSGGWGPDIIQTLDVTIENCTFSTVNWACIGLRGKESTNGQIRNNILCQAQRAVDDRMDFTPANPVIEYNLTFKTAPLEAATNINGKDPLFVDPQKRNFRLKQDSPAIGAGKGGMTIGALEYPNVYFVDPRHPAAADEPAWGYPAVPLASLSKACAIAQPGETILLRGGIYRDVLAPKNDGVTVRAMQGETVTISGADLIEGWKRQADGSWSAPLAAEPKKLLRDGRPWNEFRYDKGR